MRSRPRPTPPYPLCGLRRSAGSAPSSSGYCYNLDLANNKDITLADVLGEDWVNICNTAVQAYIDQDTSGLFFTADKGGFTTVDDTTSSI